MVEVNESKEEAFSGLSMIQLQDIAETICGNALDRAYPPVHPSRSKSRLEALLQDSTFLQRFIMGMARETACLLAANDNRVLSIYLFQESTNSHTYTEASSSLGVKIHLLILVRNRSAALHALASALDQALLREVHKQPVSLLNLDESLLNPLFITEADVAQQKGYAILLSSAMVPPLNIWKRRGNDNSRKVSGNADGNVVQI